MSKNAASITAVMGASGSGKSAWLKQQLAKWKPRRLMVWDPMDEYGHLAGRLSTLAPVIDQLKLAGKRGGFVLVFDPSHDEKRRLDQFNVWCLAALAAGELTFIAEELRFVTRPGWAPTGWAKVTMTGRHKGLRVIGTSQRPASIDKDFFGNCTVIHTGRLAYPDDVRTVARAMNVPEADLAALQPLQWMQKDMTTGSFSKGTIRFPSKV